jgi:hypothetical protein
MSFKNLEVLQRKSTKSKGIMPHLKKYAFGTKKLKKKPKIATQILTIQKSLTIK